MQRSKIIKTLLCFTFSEYVFKRFFPSQSLLCEVYSKDSKKKGIAVLLSQQVHVTTGVDTTGAHCLYLQGRYLASSSPTSLRCQCPPTVHCLFPEQDTACQLLLKSLGNIQQGSLGVSHKQSNKIFCCLQPGSYLHLNGVGELKVKHFSQRYLMHRHRLELLPGCLSLL